MRFDLTDLRLFTAVADAGSITHGAAEVGMSLPAASERLRDMETSGQVRLLERGRRGVTLTDAGEALAHHARVVLGQVSNMHADLITHAKAMRSSIRLLANTAAITEHLPGPLARWMAGNPQIDTDLKERQSAEIARAVKGGFADIGILSDAVATDGLRLIPFATDRLVLIASPSHTIASTRQLCFSDIVTEQFVVLSAGALYDHIEAQAVRLGARLKIRTRLRTFEGLGEMVAAGVGVAILPETAARRLKRSMKIAIIRLSDQWTIRHLSLCMREGEDLSAPTLDLISHLAKID
ncbi:LysR family transcriptional regulator [Brucella sp. BE17]|uniref:LysR family transcriptional regulator n=1 Tax=Brucella sp. BE17 TaxID=3142977 RepID=UPI0031BBA67D